VKHDLIVIGSGPVAVAAAAEGSRLGLRTLLAHPPSPAAADSVTRLRHAFASRLVGAQLAERKPLERNEWLRLAHRIEVSEHGYLRSSEAELGASPIRTARGPIRLVDASTVEVAGERHRSGAVIVSAGTRARRPARFPFDDVTVFDPGTIFQSRRPSRSLVVVGASEDGCEIASFFGALGASVLLLDRRARLLRGIDRDLLRQLHVELQAKGVEIVLEEEISAMRCYPKEREPHVVLELASGRVETFDTAVVCAGRVPYHGWIETSELTLDADERGFLATDERGQTSQPGLYAVGDVAGMPDELPVQIQAARATVRHAAGLAPAVEEHLPCSVHTIPEIAFFGVSEEACQRLGTPCVIGLAPYPPGTAKGFESKKAAPGRGLLKMIVAQETREVLGVHAIGPDASETVYTAIALLRSGPGVDRVAQALFPVPSASESIRLAACRAIASLPAMARGPAPAKIAQLF
jgi:NAD(P) transhydrogenase